MTIREAAKKLGLTKWALYKQIKQKRGIGIHFYKSASGLWCIDGRRVK